MKWGQPWGLGWGVIEEDLTEEQLLSPPARTTLLNITNISNQSITVLVKPPSKKVASVFLQEGVITIPRTGSITVEESRTSLGQIQQLLKNQLIKLDRLARISE